jgi:hypothetical protein
VHPEIIRYRVTPDVAIHALSNSRRIYLATRTVGLYFLGRCFARMESGLLVENLASGLNKLFNSNSIPWYVKQFQIIASRLTGDNNAVSFVGDGIRYSGRGL